MSDLSLIKTADIKTTKNMVKCAFIAVLFLLLKAAKAAYVSTKCGFHGPDYSIKWAFEPQTQSIVFVLKTTPPTNFSEDGTLVTGVAFEMEKQEEFIGVAISKQNDRKMKVIEAKAYGGTDEGMFEIISDDDRTSKVREITLKKRQDGDIIAEFARPLKGKNERELLMGCKTFQFPTKWAWVPPGSSTFSLLAKHKENCELVENCLLDVQEIKKKIKHRDSPPSPVDIAHSVDVSGKGDPCSFKSANYDVRWAYDSKTASVNFVMAQKAKIGKWWSAVGIGDNMSDMDIGVVFLNGGEPDEMGDYYSNSYGMPEKDAIQDWELDKGACKWDDEQVELHFSRQLTTKDTEKDRSLDGCVLFQFTANGGTYGHGYQIHKHESWPDLYKACDLKKHCVRANSERTQQQNLENEGPEISHSNDGTNGSRIDFASEEQQQAQSKETEGQSNSSKLNETVSSHEKEQRGKMQGAQNGNWTGGRGGRALNPLKKRAEETETLNANVEAKNALGKNETAVGENYSAEGTAKNEPINQRSIGESPFSLNAFLGNQTEGSKLSPVGESLMGLEKNDTKEGETKFGIGQLIGDGGKESANGTLPANETAETENERTEASITNVTTTVANKVDISNGWSHRPMNNNGTSAENNRTTNDPPPIPNAGGQAEAVEQAPPSESGGSNLEPNNAMSPVEGTANETDPSNITTTYAPAETNGTKQTEETSTEGIHNSTETTDATKNGVPSSATEVTISSSSSTVPPTTTVEAVDDQMRNGTSPSTTTTTTTTTIGQPSTPENDTTEEAKTTTEMKALISIANNTTAEEKHATTVAKENQSSESNEETLVPSTVTTITNATGGGETKGQKEFMKNGQEKNATSEVQASTVAKGSGEEKVIKLPAAKSACETLRPDLPICKGYMDNYLNRVKEWADKHGELMGQQYGKACKLLAAVPHVPTLCCQIFDENCSNHL